MKKFLQISSLIYLVTFNLTVFAQLEPTPTAVEVTPTPTPTPTQEPAKPKVVFSGQFRLRPEFRDNLDFTNAFKDQTHFIGQRIRLGVNVEPFEHLRVFAQAQHSGAWGQLEGIPSAGGATARGILTSGGINDKFIALHQGYVETDYFDPLKIKVGRFEMVYGDSLLIGNLDFSNVGRSFDGAVVSYGTGISNLDLFYSRIAEDDVNRPGLPGQWDFGGVYNAFDPFSVFSALDVYALWLRDARTSDPLLFHFLTLGTRTKLHHKNLDLRAEGGVQVGQHQGFNMFAHMYDVEAGYTFPVLAGLRFAAEYTKASGDDAGTRTFERWHALFPSPHPWLGIMDILGRQNIHGLRANVGLTFSPEFNMALDYHRFYRDAKQDFIYAITAEVPFTGQPDPVTVFNRHVGDEVDVTLNYIPSKRVVLQLQGGIFLPGRYLERTLGGVLSYFAHTQCTLNF